MSTCSLGPCGVPLVERGHPLLPRALPLLPGVACWLPGCLRLAIAAHGRLLCENGFLCGDCLSSWMSLSCQLTVLLRHCLLLEHVLEHHTLGKVAAIVSACLSLSGCSFAFTAGWRGCSWLGGLCVLLPLSPRLSAGWGWGLKPLGPVKALVPILGVVDSSPFPRVGRAVCGQMGCVPSFPCPSPI